MALHNPTDDRVRDRRSRSVGIGQDTQSIRQGVRGAVGRAVRPVRPQRPISSKRPVRPDFKNQINALRRRV